MKQIKIFIASSIKELKNTRNELARFVLGLNNRFIDQNIYVQMELCEEMDNAVPYVRKQDEYNEFIQKADFIFCLFHEKVGSYTKEEFKIALDSFKQLGSPKIFTYFYENNNNIYSDEVKSMMEELDKKHHHFYSIYNHTDMIKLTILLQITLFLNSMVSLEGNQVYVDQYECMSITNIPAFSKNNNLQEKIKKLNVLRECYQKKVRLFEKDMTNKNLAGDVSVLAQKIDRITNEIHCIEENTWAYLLDMHRNLWLGNISDIQMKLYRCLEQGDISNADYYLMEMTQEIRNFVETGMEAVQKLINCTKQKIYILNIQKETEQNVSEIKKCYKECYDAIYNWANNEYAVRNFILEYAEYLFTQNDPSADQLYKKLLWLCSEPNGTLSDEECFECFYYAARFYSSQKRTEEVEIYYNKCIKILSKSKENNVKNQLKEASLLVNMGSFYQHEGKFDIAEDLYQKFIDIMQPRKELYNRYSKSFIRNTAVVYRALADLKMRKNCKGMAKIYLDESFEWMKKLCKKEEYNYLGDMADLYGSYGNYYDSYINKEMWLKAEEWYKKGVELCEELYKYNPKKHGERLVCIKHNFGGYYLAHGLLEQAVQLLREAYDVTKLLNKYNPEKYDKINICLSLGKALNKKDDPQAVEYLIKCLNYIECLDKVKKAEYDEQLAEIYHNLATCKYVERELKIEYIQKVIHIVENNYQSNLQTKEMYLACCYNDIVVICSDDPEFHELALQYLQKLEGLLPEKMETVDIEKDGLSLMQIYNNLAVLYYLPLDKKRAIEYMEKAITIAESLEKLDVDKFGSYLVEFHINLVTFYRYISRKKVKMCYIKLFEAAERLKAAGEEIYLIKLAEAYYDFFEFYVDECENSDALNYKKHYSEILCKLNDIDTMKYNEYLIRGYYIIGCFCEGQEDYSSMEKYYDKCWAFLKNISKDELATELVDFTDIYNDLSQYYQENKGLEENKKNSKENGLFRKFIRKNGEK